MAYQEPKRRTFRLDDEVWEAVKGMDISLNQYLRAKLVDGARGFVGTRGMEKREGEQKTGQVLVDQIVVKTVQEDMPKVGFQPPKSLRFQRRTK